MSTLLEEAVWMVFEVISSMMGICLVATLEMMIPLVRRLEDLGIKL